MLHYTLKITFRRVIILYFIYLGLRLAFYYFNQETFASASSIQVILAFIHGLRFDTAAILTINIPFILLSVLPNQGVQLKPLFQSFLKFIFISLNALFIFINIIDIEYFKIIGRRTSNEIITITQDISDQAGHLLLDYWYFIATALFLGFLLFKLYPAYRPKSSDNTLNKNSQRFLGLAFLFLGLFFGIRGGVQYKPLNAAHAFVQEPAVLGNLALNSTFTVVRSLKRQSLKRDHYFRDQMAIARFLKFNPEKFNVGNPPASYDNVIILILESFGSEYIGIENNGRGFTPFFDSLARQGTLFKHNYANGKRSIQALPSILAGLPALMDAPIISSVYQSNQLFGLGAILEPAGFSTSFFHGAANGTMGFNAFTKSMGIQHYYGLNEYPAALKERDYDGWWGIMDEPYLQYVVARLSQQKPPFAATIFTLSSHEPYFVPPQYKGKFPKGALPIHETIGYTDFALRQFFRTAAKQPWYQNTLFVLTGDHTHKTSRPSYQNQVGMHKVPLLFFHPGKKFPDIYAHQITQHADILPTLVDYLDIKTNKLLPFGQSLLDSAATGKALFFMEGVSTLLHWDYITQHYPDGQVKYYRYRPHGLEKVKVVPPEKRKKYEQELKGYLQYFNNGLLDNNLYYWLPKNTQTGQ